MFKEQYKGAFDEIKPDHAKIDKIFAIAEENKNKKPKIVPFRYATTIAAAIAIVMVLSVYPNFSEFLMPGTNEQKQLESAHPQIKTFENTAITAAEKTEISNDENVTGTTPAKPRYNAKTELQQNTSEEFATGNENDIMVASIEPFADQPKSRMLSLEELIFEETIYISDTKSVNIYTYSSNDYIVSVIEDNGFTEISGAKLTIIENNAYAIKENLLYHFEANGLTDDEFNIWLTEKLQ